MSSPETVYTHVHATPVLLSHSRRAAQDSTGYLLPHLRPRMRLLDVGCGTGTSTGDLAKVLGAGQVTALEVTEAAFDLARAEADAGSSPGCSQRTAPQVVEPGLAASGRRQARDRHGVSKSGLWLSTDRR